MAALAKVELQLVMHFLDCRSLLFFARSSRWLYAAADFDFAWKHAPPPRLLFSANRLSLPHQLSRSLLRHLSSVAVRWEGVWPGQSSACAYLATLLQILRISTLQFNYMELNMAQWQQLGESRALDSLTGLELSWSRAPVGFLHHLTRLPRLSSLSLDCYSTNNTDSLAELPQLQSLTRLVLSNSRAGYYGSIARCRGLRHLSMHWDDAAKPAFLRMLHSLNLRATLQSLELHNISLFPPSQPSEQQKQALQAAFSSFMQLHSLSFIHCRFFHPEFLLLHLASALPLSRLQLEPESRLDEPTLSVVTQLLPSAPQLHLSLQPASFESLSAFRQLQQSLPSDQGSRLRIVQFNQRQATREFQHAACIF